MWSYHPLAITEVISSEAHQQIGAQMDAIAQ
jgi:hypothetical protein